jgi:hypothetical protein
MTLVLAAPPFQEATKRPGILDPWFPWHGFVLSAPPQRVNSDDRQFLGYSRSAPVLGRNVTLKQPRLRILRKSKPATARCARGRAHSAGSLQMRLALRVS